MKNLLRFSLAMAALGSLTGCRHVEPWERGNLAEYVMRADRDPLFRGLARGYRAALERVMRRRWLAVPLIVVCVGLIALFFRSMPAELAPVEDRGSIRISANLTFEDFIITATDVFQIAAIWSSGRRFVQVYGEV